MKLKRATHLNRGGLTLLTALCLLLFASCNNLVETPETKIISEQKYVTVSGSMQTTGALPAVLAMSGLNGQSRTAFPSVPSTGLSYDIKAINTTDNNDIYTGTPSADNSSYTISIPAGDTEKNYKIHITVTKTILGNDYELLKGISESFPINNINPVVSKDITLKPIGEESGILNLAVNIAGSGINSARAIVQFSETSSTNITASREGDVLTFQTGEYDADGLQDGIVAGAWPVTFEFYTSSNCTGQIAFSFTEYVNMFANLTTDTWVQNGKEAWFHTTTDANGNKTTTCIVTAALVDSFKLTQIYVDSSRTTDNPSAATYTKQTGTFSNPKVSFDDAIALVNDTAKNYTIYIKGELRGPQTIPATIHANSLTIRGATGLDDSGVPQDVLNGNYVSGDDTVTVLTVNTDVPVHLKNIKITNGYGYDYADGGGMFIATGAEVWIDDGTLITGNKSYNGAAGVNNSGTCYLAGGKINLNICEDWTDSLAGGLVNTGTFIMSSGEISGNSAGFANSISCSNTSVTELYGGTINNGGISIIVGAGGTIKLGGNISIAANDKIQLNTGNSFETAKIVISSSLTGTTPLGIIKPARYIVGTQYVDIAAGSGVNLANEVSKFDLAQPLDGTELFLISNEGKLESVTPIFSFDNGTEDGVMINPANNISYDAVMYSYLTDGNDNLKASAINPYEAGGFSIDFRVDDTTGAVTARTISDGYHLLTIRVSKPGSSYVDISRLVYAKIKPVKVTLGQIVVYLSTAGQGIHSRGVPYIGGPHYMYIEGDPYPTDADYKKTCITIQDDSYEKIQDGDNACRKYCTPEGENSYVYLTEKNSTFYFYTNVCRCTYMETDLCKVNRGNTTMTRTLSSLKSTDSRHFVSGDINSAGNSVSSGPRGNYWFDVSLSDD